ncbi:MAG: Major facilitator superfamily [Candidatus Moranbacteria bacterium GW2011_GWE2_47_10]|nr:MAG: Major facilitator superfamily [Candidatus Moranbacteria bacterium GW2011_GWE2_47_10]
MPIKKKHHERIDKKKIKLITFLSFLMGVGGSSLYYIISSYLEESVGEANVGIVYSFTYLALFFLLLNFHKLINKFGKARIFFVLQFVKIVILTMLGILPVASFDAVLVVGFLMLSYITWVEMDIILESFSMDKVSGRIRGLYLVAHSLGYMVGPIVSTQLLGKFGFPSVFLFGMLLNSIFFIVTLLHFRMMKAEMREVPGIRKLMKKVMADKNLRGIYIVSTVLEIFYTLMVVYMPIYLLNQGLSWAQIGLIISLIHVPYLVLQYPAGMLADRKFGEKEMIIGSLLLLGFSTTYIYSIESPSFFVWLAVLMVTRVGASILEILRDSYFYKQVDAGDIDVIDFFRTASPVAFILGPMFASLILLFFSMKAVFIFTGMVMFLGIVPAMGLVDNLSEEEIMIKNGAKTAGNRWNFWRALERRFDIRKMIKTGKF